MTIISSNMYHTSISLTGCDVKISGRVCQSDMEDDVRVGDVDDDADDEFYVLAGCVVVLNIWI